MRITALLLASLLIAACSNVQPVTEVEEEEGPVSILTGKTGGLKWSDLSKTFDDKSTGMPVNAILWRASLEIVSLIPIADVDTFGGTIVSDWYSLPGKPNERIKVTVFVIGRELRSDAIRITVHVQTAGPPTASGATACVMMNSASGLKIWCSTAPVKSVPDRSPKSANNRPATPAPSR